MFDNIGGKIKTLAIIIAVVGIVLSIFVGSTVAFFTMSFLPLLIGVIGALVSWISSWCLCGFGELIESTSTTAACTREICRIMQQNERDHKSDDNRLARLKQLLDQGLITEEEYRTAISK